MSEPIDLSSVNNLNAITTSGYGGPHSVFDINHYKGQMRIPKALIEFNASQGSITGIGYVWVINLINYNDNNESEMMMLPPTDTTIKKFLDDEMQIFISAYKPTILYFPATGHKIPIADFDGIY